MNRTLIERVRYPLEESKLLKSFRGEALYTITYIINLVSTVALQGGVPENVQTGKKTSYDHLRVFGCKTQVHVPKDERSNLDAKSRSCIFVNYSQDKFSYKLYDLVVKKFVRSHDLQNQTIDDIGMTDSHICDDLIDFEVVSISELPTRADGGADMQYDDVADD